MLPFPHYPVNGTDPIEQKDIWFSFVGFNTHPTRKKLFTMQTPKSAIIKERKAWHFQRDVFDAKAMSKTQQAREKNEYQQLLARSRFSLCPRGTGASTIRPWESLQAGAIPVLISDDMQLPEGFDWSSCMIRIREKDIGSTVSILQSIDSQEEVVMRKNCLRAYNLFIKDDFANTIRMHYENQD